MWNSKHKDGDILSSIAEYLDYQFNVKGPKKICNLQLIVESSLESYIAIIFASTEQY